jgi:hypothetical protein
MWKQQLSKKYMYVCYLCWSAMNSYLLTIFITANTVQHTGFNNKKKLYSLKGHRILFAGCYSVTVSNSRKRFNSWQRCAGISKIRNINCYATRRYEWKSKLLFNVFVLKPRSLTRKSRIHYFTYHSVSYFSLSSNGSLLLLGITLSSTSASSHH